MISPQTDCHMLSIGVPLLLFCATLPNTESFEYQILQSIITGLINQSSALSIKAFTLVIIFYHQIKRPISGFISNLLNVLHWAQFLQLSFQFCTSGLPFRPRNSLRINMLMSADSYLSAATSSMHLFHEHITNGPCKLFNVNITAAKF